jgi:hypothetical protein
MGIIEEIDKREKRLQAIIEISEERLRHLEELGPRAWGPQVRDYSVYYVLLLLAWIVIGLIVLVFLSKRTPGQLRIPLLPYVLLAVVFSIPLFYYLLTKGKGESTLGVDFVERERMARMLLERFYKPLREAVVEENQEKIEELANRLLDDPVLAEAMEKLHEGDPKRVAYALLLYSKYTPELEEEVKNTLESLTNRPARALLETLLGKGYNPGEQSNNGGNREA